MPSRSLEVCSPSNSIVSGAIAAKQLFNGIYKQLFNGTYKQLFNVLAADV